jgi:copper(I)-binding protein
MAGTASADQAGQISAEHAWIRVLPAGLPAGGYVVLRNKGDQAVALTSASSSHYAAAMLHQSSTEGGMGRMRMVDRLDIPAHGETALAPGGYHLMLMQASTPVQAGETIPVSLTFADGSQLKVPFLARPANAVDAGNTTTGAMDSMPMEHPSHDH